MGKAHALHGVPARPRDDPPRGERRRPHHRRRRRLRVVLQRPERVLLRRHRPRSPGGALRRHDVDRRRGRGLRGGRGRRHGDRHPHRPLRRRLPIDRDGAVPSLRARTGGRRRGRAPAGRGARLRASLRALQRHDRHGPPRPPPHVSLRHDHRAAGPCCRDVPAARESEPRRRDAPSPDDPRRPCRSAAHRRAVRPPRLLPRDRRRLRARARVARAGARPAPSARLRDRGGAGDWPAVRLWRVGDALHAGGGLHDRQHPDARRNPLPHRRRRAARPRLCAALRPLHRHGAAPARGLRHLPPR